MIMDVPQNGLINSASLPTNNIFGYFQCDSNQDKYKKNRKTLAVQWIGKSWLSVTYVGVKCEKQASGNKNQFRKIFYYF